MDGGNKNIRSQKRNREFVLDEAREALLSGQPYAYWGLDVIPSVIDGTEVLFATDKLRDPIQRCHRNGEFYEEEELTRIREIFPKGGVFVDIGSNIGNHSLFVAKFLEPQKIIPFEPNPLAYRLLMANIAMNGLRDLFDVSYVGLGLSDKAQGGFAMTDQKKNLGAAKMVAGEGDLEVVRGDDALRDINPDLLKIDVEGMEIMVLSGLEETIARAKPRILIEVDQANYDAFDAWVEKVGYQVTDVVQRYRSNKNFFLEPKSD